MPYVRPRAVAEVTGLSWDAFPAPTPEAEEWKPDPNSMPVAGGLPDPRFNKDPLTQQQKKAFKRDKLLGLYLDGPSESTTVVSTASSASRTSIPTNASEPSSKTPIPAWAQKFEHLLNESSPKELALQSAPLGCIPLAQPTQAAPVTFVSTPPHLRKQSSSTSATPVAVPKPRLNGVEVITAPQAKVQPTAPLAALPSSSNSPLRNSSVATRFEPSNLVEESVVQKRLLESFIPKKPNSLSEGHELYLKAKLLNIMEDEMDMVTRTTRRGLNNMSEKELYTHFNKTKSMHKLSWDIKQKRHDSGEMNLKPHSLHSNKRSESSSGAPTTLLENLLQCEFSTDFFNIDDKAMITVQEAEDKANSASELTITFHEEQDGKPATTLIMYTTELPERSTAGFLSVAQEPSNPARTEETLVTGADMGYKGLYQGEHLTDHTKLDFDHTKSRHIIPALVKLNSELDGHFERLKSEYDHKKGAKWNLFRHCNCESWL
ncbi:hypothetical protein N0V86_000991 [Didymella sp. IMI 355093]|nr:hypothetical protein N0V86_000991 [Didymella sp. IMI 355093]